MADTETSPSSNSARRCAGRTAAVDRSALEPERGRLAIFPEQGNRVWRARRGAIGRDRGAAALSSGNAWISMVLVTANWRRRGIATKLVDACLNAATSAASPPGSMRRRPAPAVYGPLGFTPTLQLRRLRLESSRGASAAPRCRPGELDRLIARDVSAMGFDRSALLTEFGGRTGSRMFPRQRHCAGPRRPHRAPYRPAIRRDADRALALVDAIVRSEQGPLLIDAVHSQEDFLQGLTDSGWNIERPFQRMRFGRATARGRTAVRRRRPGIWIGSSSCTIAR